MHLKYSLAFIDKCRRIHICMLRYVYCLGGRSYPGVHSIHISCRFQLSFAFKHYLKVPLQLYCDRIVAITEQCGVAIESDDAVACYGRGACQRTCRLVHAANRWLSMDLTCALIKGLGFVQDGLLSIDMDHCSFDITLIRMSSSLEGGSNSSFRAVRTTGILK
jgi:hypothetical protein